ncbi:response regulator [uncultured Massilia sp.]|uniref:response regulator n=1 Tax=uncultured Massilia sp. TaxID=169973 RepID=UPI002582A24B|nr:response regulator [uncultured Massilia sp.]
MASAAPFNLLLVEPVDLLRRTVSMTLRSLGIAEVTEAPTYPTAQQMCNRRRFDGVVVALDGEASGAPDKGLSLVQQIRAGDCAIPATTPVAVLVDSCNTEQLHVLRSCGISRILIKPFRVRDVIDTVDAMRAR